jgi:hypothetical protein
MPIQIKKDTYWPKDVPKFDPKYGMKYEDLPHKKGGGNDEMCRRNSDVKDETVVEEVP